MVCGAFGCQYGSQTYYGPPRTTHNIPSKDQKWLRAKWLTAIHRKDYDPAPKAFVCSIHFKPEDFLSPEENLTKRGQPIKKIALRPNAVPSLYMKGGQPQYTKEDKVEREKKDLENVDHDHGLKKKRQCDDDSQNSEVIASTSSKKANIEKKTMEIDHGYMVKIPEVQHEIEITGM